VSGYLLDTNVVSELKKPYPNNRVVAFIAGEFAAAGIEVLDPWTG